MARIVVKSQWEDYGDRLSVGIFEHHDNGDKFIAAPLAFHKRDGSYAEPTLSHGEEFLQACMNHAWEIGMRPVGFNDTKQQVAAMNDHLQDMRALVFKSGKP